MRSGKYLVLSRNRSLHVCWARICRKSWRDVKNGLKSVVDSCANSFSNPMPLSTVPTRPNLSQTTLVDGSVQLVSITMKPWSTIMYFWSKLWINAISIKNSEKKIQKNCYLPFNLWEAPSKRRRYLKNMVENVPGRKMITSWYELLDKTTRSILRDGGTT